MSPQTRPHSKLFHLSLMLAALLALPAPALAQDLKTGDMGKLFQGVAKMFKTPEAYKKTFQTNPNADPNSVTISATHPVLSDRELVEIGMAKTASKWGKRGDIGLYFPAGVPGSDGKQKFVLGKAAEQYIKKGGSLGGMATVGMPVDDYGSANLGKTASVKNAVHAFLQARNAPVFRKAMHAIGKKDPALAAAAKKYDLGNAGMQQALAQRAATDPKLARALMTLTQELSKPTAFVVNGFGVAGNDAGSNYYGMHKQPANRRGQPTKDKVVAGKVADLLSSWWKEQFKLQKNAPGLPQPRLFSVNHCAGTYEDADWTRVLEKKLKKQDPKLARKVMNRTYAMDLGAGASRPDGVKHRVILGAMDMFGHLNTPSKVLGEAKIVNAGHMVNTPVGKELAAHQRALPLKPFHQVFGLSLYGRQVKGSRGKRLARMTRHYETMAQQQKGVRQVLDRESPREDKMWTTYRIAAANMEANGKIFEARARRAQALGKLAQLKKGGASAAEIKEAWAGVKQARRQERNIRSSLKTRVTMMGLGRNLVTDGIQYKTYIHGGQESAQQRHLEKKGPKAVERHNARQLAAGRVMQAQMVDFYGRAKGALQAVRNQVPQRERGIGGNNQRRAGGNRRR